MGSSRDGLRLANSSAGYTAKELYPRALKYGVKRDS